MIFGNIYASFKNGGIRCVANGIRTLPRLDISPPDTSSIDTSPTGQFADRHFPDLTFSRPDIFSTRHFPERIFTRLHISPTTLFPLLYILFPSRHFFDCEKAAKKVNQLKFFFSFNISFQNATLVKL